MNQVSTVTQNTQSWYVKSCWSFCNESTVSTQSNIYQNRYQAITDWNHILLRFISWCSRPFLIKPVAPSEFPIIPQAPDVYDGRKKISLPCIQSTIVIGRTHSFKSERTKITVWIQLCPPTTWSFHSQEAAVFQLNDLQVFSAKMLRMLPNHIFTRKYTQMLHNQWTFQTCLEWTITDVDFTSLFIFNLSLYANFADLTQMDFVFCLTTNSCKKLRL